MAVATLVYLAVSWFVWGAAGGEAELARLWVPMGVAFGFVAAWGARVVPGVMVAAAASAWLAGAAPGEVAAHVAAVLVPAWAGGALWRSILNGPGPRTTADRVLWLAPVATAAALLSAAIVHVRAILWGDGSALVVLVAVAKGWFGHLVLVLVVTPFLWAWTRPVQRRAADRLWVTFVVLGMPILLALSVWAPIATDTSRAPLAFLAVPFVFLAAVRFDERRTSLVGAIVGTIALVGTLRGSGPFGGGTLADAAGLAGWAGGTALLATFVSTMWSERQDLRASLESSQRRWRDLVRSAPEVILAVDRRSVVQMTNKRGDGALARLDPGGALIDTLVPEHRSRLQEKLDVVFWNGTDTSVEVDVTARGAPPRTFALRMAPLREGDRITGAMVIGEDVTERNRIMERLGEREERLRAVYDRSPMATALLSSDGRILEFNVALEQLLAAGDLALDGYEMEHIVHPEDRPRWSERFDALARGARSRFEEDVRLVRRDGTPVWTRVTSNAVRDDEGVVRFAVTQWEDQSARQRAVEAEQLADMRASEIGRLEEVSAWKSELLHIASHEIKNPLTPLRLQLDLMEREVFGSITEKQQRAVRVMQGECERLASLVSGILDAARLEAGRLAVQAREMDLARVVDQVAEPFRALADEHGIAFDVDASRAGPVVADPERLGQVVVNFLSNAFKFTPSGGIVRLVARLVDDRAVVEVIDTGPGMDDEQQARLFQAFSQVHDPSSGHKGGIGLGLYVSRGIVETHGGRIWCRSGGTGRGSTFGFEVPIAGPPGGAAAEPESLPASTEDAPSRTP